MRGSFRGSLLTLWVLIIGGCGGLEPAAPSNPQQRSTVQESGCEEPTPGYVDADGDGFSVPIYSTEPGCETPTPAPDEERDCNDLDPSISPSAEEVCDHRDNDCDSGTDEDGACPPCGEFRCLPPEAYESVEQYFWQGQAVYYVRRGCCDLYHVVLTRYCAYLCAPDGGFTGSGDGRCPEFRQEAVSLSCPE